MIEDTRTATSPHLSARVSARVIENMNVELEASLGRARLTIARLAACRPGETIELETALNEAVELRLGGEVVARGELVAVGDKFGVRLTEIAQWAE